MHARTGSEFVSCRKPTRRSQSGGCDHHHQKLWPASIYVIRWKLLFHSTILFLAHIRLIPSSFPPRYDDAVKTFREGTHDPEVCWNRSHHHQEEDEMAKAGILAYWHFCYLVDKKMGKWLPSVCQFIITRLGGYPKLFIILVGHIGYHHYWLTI